MKSDKEKHSLRGLVKSVYIETAEFKEQDGQLVEMPWFSHTITFGRDGSIIESINRNPDRSTWHTINEYSDAGNLIATRNYDSAGQLSGQMLYVYDSEGRLIAEQNILQDGGVITPTTYSYDNRGQKKRTQMLNFPEDKNVMIGIEGTDTTISARQARRIQTLYNEEDEVVEVEVYNADGVLLSRVEITRDAQGNPIEETQYTGDTVLFGLCSSGSCSIEEEASFTEEQKAGFASEVTRMFTPGTGISKRVHRYDEGGRLVESKLMIIGMIANHHIYKYDEGGTKCEELIYDEEGTVRTKMFFRREYDEQANWTKEVISMASDSDAEVGLSTPCNVTRRRITYY